MSVDTVTSFNPRGQRLCSKEEVTAWSTHETLGAGSGLRTQRGQEARVGVTVHFRSGAQDTSDQATGQGRQKLRQREKEDWEMLLRQQQKSQLPQETSEIQSQQG